MLCILFVCIFVYLFDDICIFKIYYLLNVMFDVFLCLCDLNLYVYDEIEFLTIVIWLCMYMCFMYVIMIWLIFIVWILICFLIYVFVMYFMYDLCWCFIYVFDVMNIFMELLLIFCVIRLNMCM